jgi:hypothetical protein
VPLPKMGKDLLARGEKYEEHLLKAHLNEISPIGLEKGRGSAKDLTIGHRHTIYSLNLAFLTLSRQYSRSTTWTHL